MELQELGQTAYEAYGDYTGWKTPSGANMQLWRELSDNVKNAWQQSAVAIATLSFDPNVGPAIQVTIDTQVVPFTTVL